MASTWRRGPRLSARLFSHAQTAKQSRVGSLRAAWHTVLVENTLCTHEEAAGLSAECIPESLAFPAGAVREVVARFDGGTSTSDGGAMLLREAERVTGFVRPFAASFTDHRDARRVEHPLATLVAQSVYPLALGCEDLNDHDALRADPHPAVVAGSADKGACPARRVGQTVGMVVLV